MKSGRRMAMPLFLAVLSLCVIAAPYLLGAEPALPGNVTLPDRIAFHGPANAPQTAVIFGDPAKAELYVERYKFPKGQKLMPHWHSDAVRTVVVLSGTLYYAEGEQWDEAKLRPFPAGTFFYEPKGMPHFAWAKDGEVELQLTAVGPSGTTLVEAQKP